MGREKQFVITSEAHFVFFSKDAVWIGFNRSLKCYNPGDIYLLMKTSDVVSNLLEDPYRECGSIDSREEEAVDGAAGALPVATSTTPYVLVLKEWNDSWGPDMEFRCFICANQLIGNNIICYLIYSFKNTFKFRRYIFVIFV